MNVTDLALKKRTSVLVLCGIILILGFQSYASLPRESEPDISIPNVFIATEYKGVSPADIETAITVQIEKKLQGLQNVKKIISTSSEGLSAINIEFVAGTDIDEALEKVRNKVDEAKGDLPDDLENDPRVFEVNFSEFPILVLSLTGIDSYAHLKEISDDLGDQIESIPGVLEVNVLGGFEREIRVEPDPERLAYYRIPITAMTNIVRGENRNLSGGTLRMGDGRFQLRVPGEFQSPEEIYELVVGVHDGKPVYLKDVARVVDGFKESTSLGRLNGQKAVNISIKKRTGENVLEINDAINALLLRDRPRMPRGLRITRLMDRSRDIKNMVSDLENNLITGLLLVLLVIPFAMGFRNAIFVGLAIPFSMLLSFVVLSIMGITLNMVVLYALTLAVGMLVDNAIVIVENIYRFTEQGVPRLEASGLATREVAFPVIGSTITTLAAFVPLLPWPGVMGDFMYYLPVTLIITLTSSLFVAMVINPTLCSLFMKTRPGAPDQDTGNAETVLRAGERPATIQGPILKAYRWLLRRALASRLATVMIGVLVSVLMFQVWLLRVGAEKPIEFFPAVDPNGCYVNIEMPEGAGIDFCDRMVRYVEVAVAGMDLTTPEGTKVLTEEDYREAMKPKTHELRGGGTFDGPSDLENLKFTFARSISTPVMDLGMSLQTPNHLGVEFTRFNERVFSSRVAMEEIRRRVANIPGARLSVQEGDTGPPTGSPINVEIVGDDFQVLAHLAEQVKEMISRVPHVRDVEDNYVSGSPAIQVDVDRRRAALQGLSTESVGQALKIAFNGEVVSTYREGNEDYDITVQLSEADRKNTDVLRHLLIPTPGGDLVPLTSLAKISYTGLVGDINRINRERAVTVKANVDETKIPGPVARAQAEELLKELYLPPGYQIRFTGELEIQQESETFLSNAFAISLFLILLILVTQFNSLAQPFIILTSVLLSLGGVFLGLAAMNMSFGIIMTGVGVISLAGVVVNNAIVLVDYINQLRSRGYATTEAVVAAGCTRLRPILLTAITTILGLLPMVAGVSFDFREMAWNTASESSQWWKTMASAVIFGLAAATLVNLIVVPVLYSLSDSFTEFMKRRKPGPDGVRA